jgi:transcriptional regulator with XRE-family HTH domain
MKKAQDLPEVARRFQELRLKRGLTQKEMAEQFGVSLRTWQNWENGITEPVRPVLTLLSQFEAEERISFPERCKRLRESLSFTRQEMAQRLGIQPNTWGYWESGKQKPSAEARKKLEGMLARIKGAA